MDHYSGKRKSPPGEHNNLIGLIIDSYGNVTTTVSATTQITDYIHTCQLNSNDGTLLWEQSYKDVEGNSKPHAIALDSSGDVIVVGASDGEGRLNEDYLVIKYKGNTGEIIWKQSYGHSHFSGSQNSSRSRDYARAIALDSFDNIAVTGVTTDNNIIETVVFAKESGNILARLRLPGMYAGSLENFDILSPGRNGRIVIAAPWKSAPLADSDVLTLMGPYTNTASSVKIENVFLDTPGLRLDFLIPPGRVGRVQTSPNLQQWKFIGDQASDLDGVATFYDNEAQEEHRFYRVISP